MLLMSAAQIRFYFVDVRLLKILSIAKQGLFYGVYLFSCLGKLQKWIGEPPQLGMGRELRYVALAPGMLKTQQPDILQTKPCPVSFNPQYISTLLVAQTQSRLSKLKVYQSIEVLDRLEIKLRIQSWFEFNRGFRSIGSQIQSWFEFNRGFRSIGSQIYSERFNCITSLSIKYALTLPSLNHDFLTLIPLHTFLYSIQIMPNELRFNSSRLRARVFASQ